MRIYYAGIMLFASDGDITSLSKKFWGLPKQNGTQFCIQNENVSFCSVTLLMSWLGNWISYYTCITSVACLVAAVMQFGTLALSSTEITNTLFDPNNTTMASGNYLVANVRSSSLCQFHNLF